MLGGGDLTGEEIAKLSKEYSDLTPIVENVTAYENALSEQEDLQSLLDDPEMKDIAEGELEEIKKNLPQLEDKIKRSLIPKDKADHKNAILEIRAGTGGDEAALFASDLFTMYK